MTAVAVLGATSASAQQSITVTNPDPGDQVVATTDLTVLTNESTGVSFECITDPGPPEVKASRGTATVPSDSYVTPAEVGGIDGLGFNNCNGPLGPVTAVPDPASYPYPIRIDSYDSGTDQAAGYVTGVDVDISMSGCSFTVVGDAPGVYDNAAGQLQMGAPGSGPSLLTPIDVVGCFGFVNPGDELSYVGDYDVTPPLTITSP